MTISVRDARLSEADRLWIEGIYRDYLDDLAPLDTGIFPALGEVGHREPDQVAHWFADPGAYPLVIVRASEHVGFALVVRERQGASYRMAEFFVSRANRGRGVGRGAAQLILDRFAGRWEIVEYLRNPGAVRFWRRVVSGYTQGRFQERIVNGEVRHLFESAPKRGA